MNNISILGRLVRDIELSKTSNGVALAKFTVAVASDIKTADGKYDTDFFSCIAWRTLAENIAKFFKKGNMIGITGSMNSRTYETSSGEKKTVWELNVKNFSFAGSNNETSKDKNEEIVLEEIDDEDCPF